jgi:transcriptional regulator with XRE-family HTH domain
MVEKAKPIIIKVFDPEKARKRRRAQCMTITALAAKAKVSRMSASTWESGAIEPNFESMQRLAGALGLKRIDPLLKDKND